ncbi:sensor histidine kinase [Nonomuraea longicatena]|uniref:Signal transduction histidine kinase subgroup 3 dimerisation and phosphoacceptor domain-containing protein n=1 Tax=Nonomuraea longicatena TaxID=83682 RepID=A0ABN1QIG5_9ACTN
MSPPPLTALRRYTLWLLIAPLTMLWAFSLPPLFVKELTAPSLVALLTLSTLTFAASVLLVLYAAGGAGKPIAVKAAICGGGALVAELLLSSAVGTFHMPEGILYGAYAGAITICAPLGRRMAVGLAALVPIGLISWLNPLPVPEALLVVAISAVLISACATQWWTYEVAARLEQARKVAGELAVAEERLRFAAELHDIQGHHLQVIALKSELAARLGHSRPEAAVELMREVQQLAREALTDTKAVVGGYRQVSFRTELSNAVKVLRAAGITTQADFATAPEGETGRLFGLVVREATTNILRHSQASSVSLRLALHDDRAELMVSNDGAGAAAGDGGGLRTLARRMDEAGGRLRWAAADGRFTVTATLEAA